MVPTTDESKRAIKKHREKICIKPPQKLSPYLKFRGLTLEKLLLFEGNGM
jgi:hypothetical protein